MFLDVSYDVMLVSDDYDNNDEEEKRRRCRKEEEENDEDDIEEEEKTWDARVFANASRKSYEGSHRCWGAGQSRLIPSTRQHHSRLRHT